MKLIQWSLCERLPWLVQGLTLMSLPAPVISSIQLKLQILWQDAWWADCLMAFLSKVWLALCFVFFWSKYQLRLCKGLGVWYCLAHWSLIFIVYKRALLCDFRINLGRLLGPAAYALEANEALEALEHLAPVSFLVVKIWRPSSRLYWLRVADYGLLNIISIDGPLSLGPFNHALLLCCGLLLIDCSPLHLECLLLPPGREGFLFG